MVGLAKKLGPLSAAAVLLASASLTPIHASPAHDSTTINVWTYLGVPATNAVQKIANQWAAGKGVTVKVIPNPTSGFQGFATVARSGKGPDIGFAIPHDNLGTFQLAGLVAPVPSGTFNASDYVPAAPAGVTIGGQYFGVPLNLGTYELVYNKALVPNAPTTWDQLIKIAKTFPNTKGKNYGFLKDWTNAYFAYSIISGYGGYFFKQTKSGVDVNDIGVDTPQTIQALTFIQSMYKDGLIPSDTTDNIAGSLFQKGQLGMWVDGTWDIGTNEKALGKNFGAAPLPTLPNGKPPHPFSSIYAAFVSAFSHNQSLDWDLIKYLAARYPQADLTIDGSIPAEKSLLNSAAVQSNPIYAGYAKAVLAAQPIPNVPQMQAVWTPVQNQITLMAHGKVTPAQAGANMLKQIKSGEAQFAG